jgi:hypothetical protein
MTFLQRAVGHQKGQGTIEYVLIAVVVGLILLFIAVKFGGSSSKPMANRAVEGTQPGSGTREGRLGPDSSPSTAATLSGPASETTGEAQPKGE